MEVGNGLVTFVEVSTKVSSSIFVADNTVSPTYFSSLSPSGHRLDHSDRPELLHGTVDFPVPKLYWAPQPPLDSVLDVTDSGPNISSAAESLTTTASDLLGGLTASLGQTPAGTRGNSPVPGYKEREAERIKEEKRLRRPGTLSRVFVIDVSEGAVQRGVLRYVCEGIRRGLYGSKRAGEEAEGDEDEEVVSAGERIAIVTVAESVGFWNLSVSP